jgi:endoglucanase
LNGKRRTRHHVRHLLAPLTAGALATAALYAAASAASAAVTAEHPVSATNGFYEDPVSATNGFYVDPANPAAQWAAANPADGRASAIASAIGAKPQADWFGAWSTDIGENTGAYVGAAAAKDKLPVLVAYNIPNLDICASGAGHGAASDSAYDTWIAAFAGGIASRPALVILEPDAVADESCMSASQISDRDGLLNNAITQFTNQAPDTWVYLDAGNPGWLAPSTMAAYLNAAGLAHAHGFSLNVSNFYTTARDVTYGNAINADLSADYGYTKPFVIDTSRNTNGSDGEWCNPDGAKLGSTDQVGGGAEMLLWIKTPGESDGNCGTGSGTTAGQFVPQIAYDLIYGY